MKSLIGGKLKLCLSKDMVWEGISLYVLMIGILLSICYVISNHNKNKKLKSLQWEDGGNEQYEGKMRN